MAIKRVWIEEGCISCGMSEMNCPEVFKVDDEQDSSTVIEGVDYSLYEAAIKEAAEGCPVEVIKYEESQTYFRKQKGLQFQWDVGNEGGGNGWVIGLYGFTQAHRA